MTVAELTRNRVEPSKPKIVPIERRSSTDLPYKAFVSGYLIKNRPVIVLDAVTGWAALRTWTPEFFRKNFGSKQVEVTYGVHQPMAEVIDAVLRSTDEKPGPYLHRVMIHQHMPELLPDMMPENVYGVPCRYASPLMPKRFHHPDGYLKLLIGGVGGRFPIMHFDSDNAHALITEIYGEKEFVLFDQQETPFLYPHREKGNTSQIDDPEHPDLERFPLFAMATQYRGIIGPGDAAFVPSGWWHTTRIVSTSVSVCGNMLYSSNWAGFVSEACQPQNGGMMSRITKRIYLSSAGAAMTLAEKSQERFPDTAISRLLAVLSPLPGTASSEVH
jgi:Cupin-like domain